MSKCVCVKAFQHGLLVSIPVGGRLQAGRDWPRLAVGRTSRMICFVFLEIDIRELGYSRVIGLNCDWFFN